MEPTPASGTRGIVNPAEGFRRFALTRHDPHGDLRWAVDCYWVVRWDLRDEEPYQQKVVPHPAVHLVFERDGAHIQAITAHDFVRRLQGCGQVFGVKFRPAGFRPFLGKPIATIAGQRLPATTVFGPAVDDLARVVGDAADVNDLVVVIDGFLTGMKREALPMTAAVNAIVDHIAGDRSLTRVDDLAARLGTSTRRLERLFADHVGLGPKWVINRCRLHTAAEVAAQAGRVDWPDLALALGYSDQSHLVRDFTATIGASPERYRRSTGSDLHPRPAPAASVDIDDLGPAAVVDHDQ